MNGVVLVTVATLLLAGAAVVFARELMTAVIATAVVSLALSVLFALLRAPDVALAEAAVGAGLTGVILVLALKGILNRKGASDEDA